MRIMQRSGLNSWHIDIVAFAAMIVSCIILLDMSSYTLEIASVSTKFVTYLQFQSEIQSILTMAVPTVCGVLPVDAATTRCPAARFERCCPVPAVLGRVSDVAPKPAATARQPRRDRRQGRAALAA
ncbi:hypothetical protein [Blastochloris tepida]|uniref:Uncharacterized protein n=1 Tax=Blastochloris tepida TaxID=2233851 RepID=A0A348FYR3_9HYPH|nr:hypothetical protein [Blastochloris tepida]BBF92446.1 hypothetical protein BLTE_11310 [Blastochloris tepida]